MCFGPQKFTVGGAITAMAVTDLVSRWEQMRNDIERQLEILVSGHLETHDGAQNTTAETIERLRELRGKLEILLLTKSRIRKCGGAEHARRRFSQE